MIDTNKEYLFWLGNARTTEQALATKRIDILIHHWFGVDIAYSEDIYRIPLLFMLTNVKSQWKLYKRPTITYSDIHDVIATSRLVTHNTQIIDLTQYSWLYTPWKDLITVPICGDAYYARYLEQLFDNILVMDSL